MERSSHSNFRISSTDLVLHDFWAWILVHRVLVSVAFAIINLTQRSTAGFYVNQTPILQTALGIHFAFLRFPHSLVRRFLVSTLFNASLKQYHTPWQALYDQNLSVLVQTKCLDLALKRLNNFLIILDHYIQWNIIYNFCAKRTKL